MKSSLEIIIVLYRCTLEESRAFNSLQEELKSAEIDYELVIFNNDNQLKIKDERYVVVNSEENKKLSFAYNFALKRAVENGRKWLLLLDQDTSVPKGYFNRLQDFLKNGYPENLAAVVPVLKSGDVVLSPKVVSSRLRIESEAKPNEYGRWITAINSMSLMNVGFFDSIGGFSNKYELDMLDRWSYNQIMKHNRLVYVLDVISDHALSFLDFEKNVTPERYSDFMKMENRFSTDEMDLFYLVFYKVKLFLKGLKQLVKYKNKEFSRITFSYIFKK
ncbi:MAG: glycosyltransferase [Bacteroidia bacterium]|nr:glycosyltransferase [Bacteroidia bacterium]